MLNKISKLQWIVLIIFGLIFLNEALFYFKVLTALMNKNELLTLKSLWLIPLIADFIGIYGLYLITKFKRIGFILFYLANFTSMYFDFERGIGMNDKLITLIGNAIILLIFFLPTKKVYKLSK